MGNWKDDRNLGPWNFTPQVNKFGYINNPRWVPSPVDEVPVHEMANEPQVWPIDGNFISVGGNRHSPCGHWHKPILSGEDLPISITRGIWAYWKMEEEGGARSDSSGNGRNLIEYGGVIGAITGAEAFIGYSVRPVFIERYLKTDTSGMDGGYGVSISMWTRIGDVMVGDFGWHDIELRAGTGSVLKIISNGTHTQGKAKIRVEANASFYDSGFVYNLNEWRHIVVTCVAGLMSVYVDNICVYSGSGNFYVGSPGQVTVYVYGYSSFLSLSGMDEVGIWERMLSPLDIQYLYNGGDGLTLF